MMKSVGALAGAAALIVTMLPSTAAPQTRCANDTLGNTVCHDASGNT